MEIIWYKLVVGSQQLQSAWCVCVYRSREQVCQLWRRGPGSNRTSGHAKQWFIILWLPRLIKVNGSAGAKPNCPDLMDRAPFLPTKADRVNKQGNYNGKWSICERAMWFVCGSPRMYRGVNNRRSLNFLLSSSLCLERAAVPRKTRSCIDTY